MNKRQKLFCLSMLADKTQTQAAIDAGYSKSCADKQGSRLMKNAEIKAYLTKHNLRVAKKAVEIAAFDAADILGGLWDNAIQAKLLNKPDFSASNRAFELLGKHKRLFADVSEVVFTEGIKDLLDKVITVIDDMVEDEDLKAALVIKLGTIGKR